MSDVVATIEPTFNYKLLDKGVRATVTKATRTIKVLSKRCARDIVRIGELLAEVKLKLEYGQFGKWLQAEFGWSVRTAYRMMQVTGSCANLAQLGCATSALYLLSSQSVPHEAIEEAEAIAESGQTVTNALAQEIVDRHKAGANGAPSANGAPAAPSNGAAAASAAVDPDEDEDDEEEEEEDEEDAAGESRVIYADANGDQVPDRAAPAFAALRDYQAVCREIDQVAAKVKALTGSPAAIHARLDSVCLHLRNAKAELWGTKPGYRCPYCNGDSDDCKPCKGSGWVIKLHHDAAPGNSKWSRA